MVVKCDFGVRWGSWSTTQPEPTLVDLIADSDFQKSCNTSNKKMQRA